MNRPEEHGLRVRYEQLEAFVASAATQAGIVSDRAALLARLLATNSLRGIVSHGAVQIVTYSRLIRDGKLNGNPDIRVIRESPVSLLVDGDGGLGYFPAHDGTVALCRKAVDSGCAVLVTRNHGHFGAAGIYARIAVEHDLLVFVTSGHQLGLTPGAKLFAAAGGSPMAFGAPTSSGAPLLLDFGCMHDLYSSDPHRDEVTRLTPGIVLRSIGLGEICQSWGGFLSGLRLDADPPVWTWPGANQGALVFAFRIDLFADAKQFKDEVAAYRDRVRTLEPLPGFDESYAPGDIEEAYEKRFRREGIPVPEDHLAKYDGLADELGIGRLERETY
jgi:L-2-hydroxycarboxylate dehydrogenase (NAD+)